MSGAVAGTSLGSLPAPSGRAGRNPRTADRPPAGRGTTEPAPAGRRATAGAGFTLLEVAVTLALAALVGLAVVRALAHGRTAGSAGARASEAVLSLDLAADLLAGEVRRAGYRPYPVDTLAGSLAPTTLRLAVHTDRAAGDALSVAYLEDRLAGAPVPRELRFEVGIDGAGVAQLYRITASGAKQPLVQGVTRLAVAGWADSAGLHGRQELTAGALQPRLLLLRLTSGPAATARLLAVPLPDRPATTVEMGP